MTCDPNTLSESSKCFCLSPSQSRQVWIYLLCQWLNGGVTPLPPGCFYLTDDHGNYILDDSGNRIIVCL